MSEIVQLYKDREQTTKVYPKTIASEVYIDTTTTVVNKFDEIANQLEQVKGGFITKDDAYIKEEIDEKFNNKSSIDHIHENYTTEEKVQEMIDNIDIASVNGSIVEKVFTGETIDAKNTVEGKVKSLEIFGATEIVDGVENSVGERIIDVTAFADTGIQEYALGIDDKTYYYSYTSSTDGAKYLCTFDSLYYRPISGDYVLESSNKYIYENGKYVYSSSASYIISGKDSSIVTNNETMYNYVLSVGSECVYDDGVGSVIPPTTYKITLTSSDRDSLTTDSIEILLDEPLRSTIDGSVRDRIFEDEDGVKIDRKVDSSVEYFQESWDDELDISPMSHARSYFQAAILNNKIYVVGGQGAKDSIEIYDMETNSWSEGSPLPSPRDCHCVVGYNDKIYAIGGYGTAYLNDILIYDTTMDSWSNGTPLPSTKESFAAKLYNDKIYCIGGVVSSSTSGQVVIYDIKTNSWSYGSSMPTPRNSFAASIYEGKIYCIGGMLSGSVQTDVVEIYDISSDSWATGEPLPVKIRRACSEAYNGKIYHIGGTEDVSSYIYDIETNKWSASQLKFSKYGVAPVLVNNKIYCLGGMNSADILTTDTHILLPIRSEVSLVERDVSSTTNLDGVSTLKILTYFGHTKMTTTQNSKKPQLKVSATVNVEYAEKEEVVSKIEFEENLTSKADKSQIDAIWTEINGVSSLLDDLILNSI